MEPELLICHTCEKRAEMDRVGKDRKRRLPRYRVVARDEGMHARFMDQHRKCADEGWGTSPAWLSHSLAGWPRSLSTMAEMKATMATRPTKTRPTMVAVSTIPTTANITNTANSTAISTVKDAANSPPTKALPTMKIPTTKAVPTTTGPQRTAQFYVMQTVKGESA